MHRDRGAERGVKESTGLRLGSQVPNTSLRADCGGPEHSAIYGGEELAALFTGGDAEGVSQFAEFVRTDVQKIVFEESTLKVTVSLGVAVAPNDGREPDELVKKADARLYLAKHDGRNCVVTTDGKA